MIELHWPRHADEDLRAAVHRVPHDVVADGGAVGYTEPPDRTQTDAWLDDVLADTRGGYGAFVVASVDGTVQAFAGVPHLRRDRQGHGAPVGTRPRAGQADRVGAGRRRQSHGPGAAARLGTWWPWLDAVAD